MGGERLTGRSDPLGRRLEYTDNPRTTASDQVIREKRKTRRAGAPKHRQKCLSVRPGGWSRTPVNSSGTRLTLALGGVGRVGVGIVNTYLYTKKKCSCAFLSSSSS